MATVHVIKCASDPVAAPAEVGQHWVNTTTGAQFFSKGTSSVADWVDFSAAATALQPGDNVSDLLNDAGYAVLAALATVASTGDHSDLNLDDGTNPHGTTQADLGLGNVDNTSDADKPISTATQTALDLKYDASNPNNYIDAAGAPVQSVNGLTGAVTFDHGDLGGLGDDDHTQYHNDARGDVRYYLKSEVDDLLYSDYIEKTSDAAGSVGINNTTTQATYLSLSFTTPAAGDYDLDFFYIWSLNDGAQDFVGQLFVDGVLIPDYRQHRQEPKDTAGTGETLSNTTGGTSNSGTDQRHYLMSMKRLNLTAGAHTASIRWNSGANGDLATIYNGSIRVRRAP